MAGADPSPASYSTRGAYGAHAKYIGQGTLMLRPDDARIRPARYTARQAREGKPLAHVPNGWPHFATSGDHQGNCMCMDRCCLGPQGCRCRGCKGVGHAGCRQATDPVGAGDRPAPDADGSAVPVPVRKRPPRRYPRL